jgi:hypothetical protein
MGVGFIVRACQNRRLADEAGMLKEALVKASVLGQSTVELRSRGGESARTAIVELRRVQVDLDGPWRPGGSREPLRGLTIVEIREVHAPEGVREALHWVLLTSLPCRTLAQARQIVGRYTARWWVEEYHKALKSGAGVEDSQLERAGRLEPLIAVLAVVAVRLLNTKMLARSRPEGCEARESFGPEALEILEQIWPAQGRLDQLQRAHRDSTFGRFPSAQARRHAWLADHLARMATFDVDVPSIRDHQQCRKELWVMTSVETLGYCRRSLRDRICSRSGPKIQCRIPADRDII